MPQNLRKLFKGRFYMFKECKDPSYESKVMILKLWICLKHAQDMKAVGSGGSKSFPHDNMAKLEDKDSKMLNNAKNLALS